MMYRVGGLDEACNAYSDLHRRFPSSWACYPLLLLQKTNWQMQ